ncbi:DNA-3-methyladenine glycosylase [Patescibacteria group bacterium]
MRLSRSFYDRPTLKVARELLGKEIVREISGKKIGGKITEVEAYIGQNDPACHACRGKTPRNEIMFGSPGYAYVYLIYGMYECLNVVTEKKDFPAAVLIRGVQPEYGIETMIKQRYQKKAATEKELQNLANGPGKLCQALGITRKLNGADLLKKELSIYDSTSVSESKIKTTPRIGIKEGTDKLWRFVWEG